MKKIALLLVLSTGFFACKKEDPKIINESELITTINVQFVDTLSHELFNWTWEDLDGDGANAPLIHADTLKTGRFYVAVLNLYNKQTSPVDTITHEVMDEGTEHQFFYQVTPTSLISEKHYLDTDSNGKPIGVEFAIKTSSAIGAGIFNLILRHQPDKSASGVVNGDITNANGETDVDIEFPLRLKN